MVFFSNGENKAYAALIDHCECLIPCNAIALLHLMWVNTCLSNLTIRPSTTWYITCEASLMHHLRRCQSCP